MTWETVIGLETHVELATRTKIFCSCTTAFGGAPNTHCCPVCTGMPGTLPVLNKAVVRLRGQGRTGAELRHHPLPQVRPQELLLSRPAQGLPDLSALSAHRHQRKGAHPAARRRGEDHPHPRDAHGGGRRQAGARPVDRPDPGGLQPLRRAADRNRHRAGLPHRRGGHRLSGEAEIHAGVFGRVRLQDAGGLPPLRREPLRPPRREHGAGHPHRDEEHQLLQGHCPGHRLRDPRARSS